MTDGQLAYVLGATCGILAVAVAWLYACWRAAERELTATLGVVASKNAELLRHAEREWAANARELPPADDRTAVINKPALVLVRGGRLS